MSNDAKFTILVTLLIAVAGGIMTIGAYAVRAATKWGRTEERLTGLAEDIKELVGEIKADREAVNKRVRWLEERVWGGGTRNRS